MHAINIQEKRTEKCTTEYVNVSLYAPFPTDLDLLRGGLPQGHLVIGDGNPDEIRWVGGGVYTH